MEQEEIAKVFADQFGTWGLTLPAENLERREEGRVQSQGWHVRFVFGVDDGEEYLEYYATHRMTNDTHVRIFASGRTESLEAMVDFTCFDSDVKGAEEAAEKKLVDHNARVSEELNKRGLS